MRLGSTEPKIEVEEVSVVYPSGAGEAPVVALESVDLSIMQDEFITLLGPSSIGPAKAASA